MSRTIAFLAIASALAACACSGDKSGVSLAVTAAIDDCPHITSLTVVPLEVLLHSEIEISAETTKAAEHMSWHATAGGFGDPSALETVYRCDKVGVQELGFEIADGPDCRERISARIRCSFSRTCGNGKLEAGEECDDGNTRSFDGCSQHCLLKPLPWRHPAP